MSLLEGWAGEPVIEVQEAYGGYVIAFLREEDDGTESAYVHVSTDIETLLALVKRYFTDREHTERLNGIGKAPMEDEPAKPKLQRKKKDGD